MFLEKVNTHTWKQSKSKKLKYRIVLAFVGFYCNCGPVFPVNSYQHLCKFVTYPLCLLSSLPHACHFLHVVREFVSSTFPPFSASQIFWSGSPHLFAKVLTNDKTINNRWICFAAIVPYRWPFSGDCLIGTITKIFIAHSPKRETHNDANPKLLPLETQTKQILCTRTVYKKYKSRTKTKPQTNP